MYIIYQITNKHNNKSYVGLTKSPLKRRWYLHRWQAHHDNTQYHFHRAIRKYDISVWDVIPICSCKNKDDAEAMERHFIAEHDTYKSGYNMTEGGNAFGGLSGKHNGMYGKTHTNEVKQKLSKIALTRFKDKTYEDLYGKDKSDQLRQKRSNDMKRLRATQDLTGTNNPHAKRVHVKGIEFDTCADAAIHFGVNRSSITRWCKNREDCYLL